MDFFLTRHANSPCLVRLSLGVPEVDVSDWRGHSSVDPPENSIAQVRPGKDGGMMHPLESILFLKKKLFACRPPNISLGL